MARTDFRRWDLVWETLPYLGLLGGAVVTAGNWACLGLAVAAAGWHAWWISAHPSWPLRLRPMAVYFVGMLAFVWQLAALSPAFTPMTLALCGMAFVALPGWWAYAGSVAVGLVASTVNGQFTWWVLLFVAGAGALFGGMFRFMEGQVARRHEMVERLTALLAENADLQARLLGQAREAGATEERHRLARELHDTVAQGLAAIVTQVEAAAAAGDDPAAVRRRLGTVGTLARGSLTEARRAMDALRPGPLEESHLPAAVTDTAGTWSRGTDIPATVTVTGPVRPLHPEVEVTALRVVQEALANIARHARASRVGVTLSYVDDLLVVDVRDDGRGFASPLAPAAGASSAPGSSGVAARDVSPAHGASPAAPGGFGLVAMRERVARLAGTLDIESAPGQGTALSVRLPAGVHPS